MAAASTRHSQAAHVFVNCPFDPDYKPLFYALIFAILDCGYKVRCAYEVNDSSEVRIESINTLIEESRYGIHDISRVELSERGYPRFNMPYEMGLFIGCKRFGGRAHASKKALVLDSIPYRYQQFISDIAGQDIRYHNNDPEEAIRCIRDWLAGHSEAQMPGSTHMIERYRQFQEELPALCRLQKQNEKELTYRDYVFVATGWLEVNIE